MSILAKLRTPATIERLHRTETPHTEWCTRDHTCGLAEHRGRPIVIGPETGGRAVVTRVAAGDREYAAVTLRVPLHRNAAVAARQFGALLHGIRAPFATIAALRPAAVAGRQDRRALDSRRSAA